MIYFYQSISPQPIENLHSYIDFFFTQLFAESHTKYDHAYFIRAEFKEIISEYKDQIDDRLEAIFNAYSGLKTSEKKIVRDAYYNNNDIEAICNKSKKPYKFSELPEGIEQSITELYGSKGLLYVMLTNSNIAAYKKIKERCGTLKAHFKKFRQINKYSICPFCGMENLLTEYDDGKNEYDHYIPKSEYPFCSINFRNLVPICDYCNKSGNKGQKDIPYIPHSNPLEQELLYYPFTNTTVEHEIIIKITASNTDLSDPSAWTLNISCLPVGNSKRMDRWLEIYNIRNRYKSKISSDSYEWKNRIVSKYSMRCKKNKDTFERFKEDILDDFADYKMWNNGIVMKCFDEFILNDPNCQSYLTGKII